MREERGGEFFHFISSLLYTPLYTYIYIYRKVVLSSSSSPLFFYSIYKRFQTIIPPPPLSYSQYIYIYISSAPVVDTIYIHSHSLLPTTIQLVMFWDHQRWLGRTCRRFPHSMPSRRTWRHYLHFCYLYIYTNKRLNILMWIYMYIVFSCPLYTYIYIHTTLLG